MKLNGGQQGNRLNGECMKKLLLLTIFLLSVIWCQAVYKIPEIKSKVMLECVSGNTTLQIIKNQADSWFSMQDSNFYTNSAGVVVYGNNGKSYTLTLTISSSSTWTCKCCGNVKVFDLSTTLFNQEYQKLLPECYQQFETLRRKYMPNILAEDKGLE